MPSLTSLVGAAGVAAGSVSLVVAPRLIAPARLPDTTETRLRLRVLGARDVAIGLAMITARPGRPRRLATAARVLSDVADAVLFSAPPVGRLSPGRVVALAAASGGLSLGALVLDERAGR